MYNPPPVIGICSWEVFFPNPAIQQQNLEPVQIPNGQNTEDTTAVSLAWTMHFLARHPEVQAKARQEACENSRKKIRLLQVSMMNSWRIHLFLWFLESNLLWVEKLFGEFVKFFEATYNSGNAEAFEVLNGKKDPDADDLEKVPYINAVISECYLSKLSGWLKSSLHHLRLLCFVPLFLGSYRAQGQDWIAINNKMEACVATQRPHFFSALEQLNLDLHKSLWKMFWRNSLHSCFTRNLYKTSQNLMKTHQRPSPKDVLWHSPEFSLEQA